MNYFPTDDKLPQEDEEYYDFQAPDLKYYHNNIWQVTNHRFYDILKQFEGQKYQPDLIVRRSTSNNSAKSKLSKVVDLTVFPYKILRR